MYLNVEKIRRRIEELGRLRYIESHPIGPVVAAALDPEENASSSVTLREGDRWGERDKMYRLSFEVEIPESWRGQLLVLNLNPSAPPRDWVINTVEGLLYLDGKPFHAVDRYHREIVLPPEAAAKPKLSG